MKAFLSLLVLLALMLGVQRLLVRAIRAVLLSYEPLSGDQSDPMVYHRSLLTPGDNDNRIVWILIALSGSSAWLATLSSTAWLWLSFLAFAGSVGWDLWSWERAAVGLRRVSWRRGWRKSVRSVPVSQVAEVTVTERAHPFLKGALATKFGTVYLRLQLRTGDALKLPRTSAFSGAAKLEDVANFLRMQMGAADEEKRRTANEKRRQRGAVSAPNTPLSGADQEELRRRLVALRRQNSSEGTSPESVPAASLPPDAWPTDSEIDNEHGGPHTEPPHSRPAR